MQVAAAFSESLQQSLTWRRKDGIKGLIGINQLHRLQGCAPRMYVHFLLSSQLIADVSVHTVSWLGLCSVIRIIYF